MPTCCFEAISGKFIENFSFLVQKVTISEKAQKNTEFYFLNNLKSGKSWANFWFVYTTVFDQTSELGEILTKTSFSPQSEPHTTKLCSSVVLKHFGGNSQRTSLFCQKWLSQKQAQNTDNVCFS